ncbi:hypothetical protein OMP38_14660 [Cohnella ginsengisoli]|uniref:Uncharacterized protein n=1 Tax=Cohnella ginsengisoli TaxID=425004 RepID=A0A9X4QMQ1_9BACL|nr:hypothetical protein [Cohnella ginsengisoli]MDG0791958.1 hypothetical protein [Cohnella ginsengisoli]
MNERAIDRVMEAMARFMLNPQNPAFAGRDFLDIVGEYGREALLDWEEDKQAREEREAAEQPVEWRQTA